MPKTSSKMASQREELNTLKTENKDVLSSTSTKLFPIFGNKFRPKKPDPLQSIQLTIQKTNAPKRKRSLLGTKETQGLSQMLLDAGQKVLGPRFCGECGLLYSPGDYQDEEMHRKSHSRLDNMFTIKLWKNAQILQHNGDGTFIVSLHCGKAAQRIIKRLDDFLSWLDSEIGAAYDSFYPHEKILLCVFPTKRKDVVRILGCAIMETLQMNRIVAYSLESKDSTSNANVHSSKLSAGVTRLWTDKNFRKRRIATRLCDALRMYNGIPGMVISKSQIGILEPSEEGLSFFIKYTEGQGAHYTYSSVN